MRICITGTPGTGKSTVARIVFEDFVDLNEFARKIGCIDGKDRKRDVEIVDVECLKTAFQGKDEIILVSHYSHFMDCDIIIVLRTRPDVLEKRLRDRNYGSDKIRENLEAEALSLITQEAIDMCENVYEVDTTSITPEEAANAIRYIIDGRGENYRAGKIDYTEEIMKWY